MLKLTHYMLVLSHISNVYSLPGSAVKREARILEDRAITIPAEAEPTTSYSKAITSLQSASPTIPPSLTGVSDCLNVSVIWTPILINVVEHFDCPTLEWSYHRRPYKRTGNH